MAGREEGAARTLGPMGGTVAYMRDALQPESGMLCNRGETKGLVSIPAPPTPHVQRPSEGQRDRERERERERERSRERESPHTCHSHRHKHKHIRLPEHMWESVTAGSPYLHIHYIRKHAHIPFVD